MRNLLFVSLFIISLSAGERFVKIDSANNGIIDKSTQYFKTWSIVLDKKTNLMWEIKSSTNLTQTYDWESAIDYCEKLVLNGYSDWRLPNQYEIKSLIDYTQNDPVVNKTYFPPEVVPARIWSSTSENDANAWYLALHNGEIFYNKKTYTYGVMCVRSDF